MWAAGAKGPQMNLSQLRTFVSVVDHGSFSEAARILGLSQPSVTMQIQALEADSGTVLLDRQHRRITLTEAGAALLPHARAILAEIDDARQSIEALSGTIAGSLALAASTTPGQYVLPRLLGGFLAENPGVAITLRIYDSADVVSRVESGDADLGMTGVEVAGARVSFERLGTDELVLICPPGHPVSGMRVATFADLLGEPFVVREAGSGTRTVAEDAIRRAGVDPGALRIAMELGTNEAVVAAVEGGMGLAIVSAHVAGRALQVGAVGTVEGAGFPVARPLFLAVPRRTLTRAGEALANYLRQAL